MAAVTDLYDAAAELLDACGRLLETTAGGRPEREYVSVGRPADDCDTLTVTIVGTDEWDTSPQNTALDRAHRNKAPGRINQITYEIRVVRCFATAKDNGDPLDAADWSAQAEVASQDAWVLWCGLMRLKNSENLLGDFCSEFQMDGLQTVPTSGNIGGWLLTLSATLNGFTPVVGS